MNNSCGPEGSGCKVSDESSRCACRLSLSFSSREFHYRFNFALVRHILLFLNVVGRLQCTSVLLPVKVDLLSHNVETHKAKAT